MNNNVTNEVQEYFIDNKKIEITENFELQIWPQKIAIIAPVSGKYSKIGRSLINGIEMSIENLNKVGISIQTKIYDSGEQGLSIKKISNDVAGKADILLVPNLETGNSLSKIMVYFMGACAAGFIVGGKVPVVVTSRADNSASRIASIAAAVIATQ